MSEITDGKPQLPPGMCFICELSNPVRYIDTFRDFQGVVKERLDGRKYLCEECVEDAAKKLGFVTPKEHGDMIFRAKAAEAEVKKVTDAFTQYEDLKAIVESVGGKIVLEVAPKKIVAKKATAPVKA